ncbi:MULTISPECIES: hypothetical protein [Pseudoalteromonas]|uniref:Uncharacterized protein n=1 Tax=Pseudoalteromonas aliena SW19 TaxID=1314866 RepID=A0ABR9E4Q9_9GAMM|nr:MULTISPECIES: hypothetical protein [Pseudoalteromonas]MBE0361423.1 hypothetical protein [Pseudoalteromonas aliena SW19]
MITPALSFAKTDTPTTPEQWRSITNSDIDAAYNITVLNHLGMVDFRFRQGDCA